MWSKPSSLPVLCNRNSGVAQLLSRSRALLVLGNLIAVEAEHKRRAHATQRQFVYTHRWRVNDLVGQSLYDASRNRVRRSALEARRALRFPTLQIPASKKVSRSQPRGAVRLTRDRAMVPDADSR